jgi:hypothetical protein
MVMVCHGLTSTNIASLLSESEFLKSKQKPRPEKNFIYLKKIDVWKTQCFQS